ncbi:hypothetical protein SAMN05443248_1327 [Bradyrhizobium erythrophlei]|jgi:hypothetical protein|uniref:Uncharacterized protein n=1 Tax=Bradyrhizobium erythrophlei TaxID=1437360 RepID=A0A1M5JAC0_9BRAD|nr:hypothetical protein SAMN05443248_1327 [Bradyrhizobium erythrophlei]
MTAQKKDCCHEIRLRGERFFQGSGLAKRSPSPAERCITRASSRVRVQKPSVQQDYPAAVIAGFGGATLTASLP